MSNILITGIGGNVGYGIIKNARRVLPDAIIVGTNTDPISAGNHLCDHVYSVPFSTDENYIPEIQSICSKHQIELIIPSTDYESYVLKLHQGKLPVVAGSPAETAKAFLDKYESYELLKKAGLQFAESILPSYYSNQFGECIVKPREGRGSRNLHLNPKNPKEFDDSYIVQPLLKGQEITTAFYVTKENSLLGSITMLRSLSGGATMTCESTFDYDLEITAYLQSLIAAVDIKGSCNLQSIVTTNGIMPFEVNCRISGTNSIRSQFGFTDVTYTLDEYLFNRVPEKPHVIKGSAIRILYDVIYPGISLREIRDSSDKFHVHG